ncbi:hypothetical protein NNJEOMEG_02045 [Fundidesulfovibrio magnetotacticus]|uniref:Uncharacterized protein n=1 Tax=Fundidesulfovibrio magnetotacticus TaxID=2730080 RepID=A0A6V8M166_9BACT|nr:hypothetical protein NNJEOMEG_02045 [Fundidesulfovibrio magnetotacticus]
METPRAEIPAARPPARHGPKPAGRVRFMTRVTGRHLGKDDKAHGMRAERAAWEATPRTPLRQRARR